MRARVRTDDSTWIFTAFYKETGRENRRRIDDVCPPQDLFTFSANPPKSTIRRKMASTPPLTKRSEKRHNVDISSKI